MLDTIEFENRDRDREPSRQSKTHQEKIQTNDLGSEAINTSLIDIDQIEKDVNEKYHDNDQTELENNTTQQLENEEKSIMENYELPKFSMSEIFGQLTHD